MYDFISIDNPTGDVLDVGAGCGILSLLLKRDFNVEVTLVEKQKIMYDFAIKNLEENFLEAQCINMDFLEYKSDKKFDYIVSNPPFYRSCGTKSSDEILNIARYEDSLPLDMFLKKCGQLLKTDGKLFFCYDAKEIQKILVLMDKFKYFPTKIKFIYPSIEKEASLVLIECKKAKSKNSNICVPGFTNENNELSQQYQKISQRANTWSVS